MPVKLGSPKTPIEPLPLETQALMKEVEYESGVKKTLEPKMSVLSTTPKGSPLEQTPLPAITVPDPIYAVVRFHAGRKFSDGNYGSYDFQVALALPRKPQLRGIEQTYEACRSFVDQKLTEILKEEKEG